LNMAGADELSNFSQFYVLEMPSNHSGWFVRYHVDLH